MKKSQTSRLHVCACAHVYVRVCTCVCFWGWGPFPPLQRAPPVAGDRGHDMQGRGAAEGVHSASDNKLCSAHLTVTVCFLFLFSFH